mmetsp:Transcript_22717/g.74275  ORF Transcript_22717/g.74275 Transcript_22717/m.74275 type:complete len:277 (+) Transcript_22717:184-1014(+)
MCSSSCRPRPSSDVETPPASCSSAQSRSRMRGEGSRVAMRLSARRSRQTTPSTYRESAADPPASVLILRMVPMERFGSGCNDAAARPASASSRPCHDPNCGASRRTFRSTACRSCDSTHAPNRRRCSSSTASSTGAGAGRTTAAAAAATAAAAAGKSEDRVRRCPAGRSRDGPPVAPQARPPKEERSEAPAEPLESHGGHTSASLDAVGGAQLGTAPPSSVSDAASEGGRRRDGTVVAAAAGGALQEPSPPCCRGGFGGLGGLGCGCGGADGCGGG